MDKQIRGCGMQIEKDENSGVWGVVWGPCQWVGGMKFDEMGKKMRNRWGCVSLPSYHDKIPTTCAV